MIKKIAITSILFGLFLAGSLIAEENPEPEVWPTSYVFIHIADSLVPWNVTVGGQDYGQRYYVEGEWPPGTIARVEQGGHSDEKVINLGGEIHLYINYMWEHDIPQEL